MAFSLGEIKALLTLDGSEFLSGLADAHKGLHKFVNIMEDVSDVITGFAKDFVKAGFESSESIQSVTASFEQMAASAKEGRDFVEDLKKFAVQTPFEFEDVASMATKLKMYGFEMENVIPLMRVLGNQAKGNAEKFTRLTVAFSQIHASGKLMTQDMNQLVQGGEFPAFDVAAKKLGVSVAKLRDMMKGGKFIASGPILAEFVKVMNQMSGGQMEKATQRMAGSWTAMVEDMKLKIGEVFIPLDRAIARLIPEIGKALLSAGTFFLPLMKVALKTTVILEGLLVVFNAMPSSFKAGTFTAIALSAALIVLIASVSALFLAISALSAGILAIFGLIDLIGLPVIAAAVVALTGLAGAFLVVAGILGLLRGIWMRNLGGIQEKVKEFADKASEGFKAAWSSLNEFMIDVVASYYQKLSELLGGLETFLRRVFTLANKMNIPVPRGFIEMKSVIGDLSRDFHKLAQNVFQGSSVMSVPAEQFTSAVDTLKSMMNQSIPEIKASVSKFFGNDIKSIFMSVLPDQAKTAFAKWLAGVKDPVAEDDSIMKGLEDLIKMLTDSAGASDLDGKVKKLGFTWDWTFDRAIEGLERLADQTTAALDAASQRIRGQILNGPMASMFDSMVSGSEKGMGDILDAGVSGGLTAALAGLTPIIGVLISVFTALMEKTKVFATIIALQDNVLGTAIREVGKMIRPLIPLVNVITQIASIVLELAFLLTPAIWQFKFLATAIGLLGAVLIPIKHALEGVLSVFKGASEAFNIVYFAIDSAMWLLFQIFKGIGLVMLLVGLAMGEVWNGMMKALISVLELVQKIPGLDKLVGDIVDELESSLVDTDGLNDALDDLWNLTWDAAKAEAEHIENLEETNEALQTMTEELINVPEGFRLALARMNAAEAGPGAFSATLPHAATGAIVKKKTTLVAGEAGPEAIVPLDGRGFGTTIHIENFYSSADNIEDLLLELEVASNRRGFIKSGTAISTGRRRFVAP